MARGRARNARSAVGALGEKRLREGLRWKREWLEQLLEVRRAGLKVRARPSFSSKLGRRKRARRRDGDEQLHGLTSAQHSTMVDSEIRPFDPTSPIRPKETVLYRLPASSSPVAGSSLSPRTRRGC